MADTAVVAEFRRRVADLESERDELRRDVELLCMQEAGYAGAVDVMARMQARRTSGLENELASCRHTISNLNMELADLKHDMNSLERQNTEMKRQLESEKQQHASAQQEVQHYQRQIASALMERDSALHEAEVLAKDKEDVLKRLKVAATHHAADLSKHRQAIEKRMEEERELREEERKRWEREREEMEHKAEEMRMEMEEERRREKEIVGVAARQFKDHLSAQMHTVRQLQLSHRRLQREAQRLLDPSHRGVFWKQLQESLYAISVSGMTAVKATAGARATPRGSGEGVGGYAERQGGDGRSERQVEGASCKEEQAAESTSESEGKGERGRVADGGEGEAGSSTVVPSSVESSVAQRVGEERQEGEKQEGSREIEKAQEPALGSKDSRGMGGKEVKELVPALAGRTVTASWEKDVQEAGRPVTATIVTVHAVDEWRVGRTDARARLERRGQVAGRGSGGGHGDDADATEEGESIEEVLSQAMKQKVDALLLLAQEEERGMRQQRAVERLQAEVADLRSSLAQVTQEKVMALLQAADMTAQFQAMKARSEISSKSGTQGTITASKQSSNSSTDGTATVTSTSAAAAATPASSFTWHSPMLPATWAKAVATAAVVTTGGAGGGARMGAQPSPWPLPQQGTPPPTATAAATTATMGGESPRKEGDGPVAGRLSSGGIANVPGREAEGRKGTDEKEDGSERKAGEVEAELKGGSSSLWGLWGGRGRGQAVVESGGRRGGGQGEEKDAVARLRVDLAALEEAIASIEQIAQSSFDTRLKVAEVLEGSSFSNRGRVKDTSESADTNSGSPYASALLSSEARAVIEKAATDAKQMKVVFGAAAHLPLSWQAGDAMSPESTLSPAARAGEVVSSVGLEVAELMLAWTSVIKH